MMAVLKMKKKTKQKRHSTETNCRKQLLSLGLGAQQSQSGRLEFKTLQQALKIAGTVCNTLVTVQVLIPSEGSLSQWHCRMHA